MKILFFGSNGWIGKQFIEYLNGIKKNDNDITIIETNVRADNETLVEDVIIAHAPTHIISFIGRTHGEGFNTIDYLEQEGKLVDNIRDNLYSPVVLAHLSNKYNIHYTYLGTGCIFNRNNPEDYEYRDDDRPDFFGSSYSIVKGFTDRIMHLYKNKVLNLRIRMPIVNYNHPRNFITKITNYEKICSMPNSMTVLDDFYPIIYDMMKKETSGTFNMCNKGLISHNEILEMYRDIVNADFKWNNFTIEEQNSILSSKRSNNYLSTNKLKEFGYDIPDIKESVRNALLKMKQQQ